MIVDELLETNQTSGTHLHLQTNLDRESDVKILYIADNCFMNR